MRLNNKVIIVTGSCTGIGKAIAERAVAEADVDFDTTFSSLTFGFP